MRYRLQFRRYRQPFRAVVRTAHGVWAEREGILVRVEDEGGVVGFGEAAPMPAFGTETVDEDDAGVRSLGEWVDENALGEVPARLGCLRNALAAALSEGRGTREGARGAKGGEITDKSQLTRASPSTLAVAALLPAGRAALAQIEPKAEAGFRIFKWKVGVGDVADELALLDDVCAALPSGAKLRLDANGAWDRRKAERWLERCAERPIEFVEQPCFGEGSACARAAADKSPGETRKEMDLLLGLAGDYPTPIALDESLIGEGDVERWLGAGWPGVYVVKPSLLGEVRGALARLEKAKAEVVFSSALETAVGARAALGEAFAWAGAPRALGFGVWPLFADSRFDGPMAAPFLRREDLERIDVEAAWNALS